MATRRRIVHIEFWNSYPGRFPGEEGLLTKTILRLHGADSRTTRIVRRISDLERKLRSSERRADKARNGIMKTFWIFQAAFMEDAVDRAIEKARARVRSLLSEASERLNWEYATCTSEPLCAVPTLQKRLLAERLRDPERTLFYLVPARDRPEAVLAVPNSVIHA